MKTKSTSAIVAFGACVILLSTIGNLRAATLAVTSAADSGAGTLRAALASANNGDTINFALPTPSKITLTSGELVVSNSVNILGPGTNNLAVDGHDQWRVFHVIGSNNTDTISGLTITNGYVQSGSGGGLNNQGASLTISNCVLAGNEVSFFGGPFGGGAIFNAGQLVLIGSTIDDNFGYPNGGGICNNGVLAITNCIISGNQGGLSGGGIYNVTDSTPPYNAVASLQVANSIISSNVATDGAGIKNSANQNGANVITTTATALIVDSTVSGNAMADQGGGFKNVAAGASLSISARATLTIIASSIIANQAGEGAGIDNRVGDGSAVVAITNSTISGNSAVSSDGSFSLGPGGGIFNGPNSGTGTVYVVNSTVASNVAGTGSGLCVFTGGGAAKAVVGSSLFDGGASTGSVVTVVSGVLGVSATLTSLGYNLCSDNGAGFLTNATDQINTDPMLGPLQENGGQRFTHAPLPGSPAIDKGKNLSGSLTDQRGFARTFDKAVIANAAGGDGTDIGAVESQSYTVVNTNDSGTGSLRQTIADSNAQPGTNTIDFAPSAYGTILLTSGALLVSESANILGPGASNLAVDGNAANRVLIIAESNAVTISDLTITNGLGGIVCGGNEAATTVSNCMVVGNLGFSGIGTRRTFFGPAGVQIVNSTLSGNSAPRGGGINNAGTAVTVLNCTLSINTADYGGAIFNDNFGSVTIHNCTLNSNSAQVLGGGIYSQSTAAAPLRIGSTVFCAGVQGANISTYLGQVPISEGYNLSSDNGGGVLTNATDQINTDPLLGPLHDNGGPTFTHAPLPGSPAIDKGKNFSGSPADQRGFARTLDVAGISNATGGDSTDIGAVEMDNSLRLINVGVVSNQFGFNLTGPFTNVVIEASTNVSGGNWTALATNTLGDAALRFSDPSAPSLPKRFYRARVQQ